MKLSPENLYLDIGAERVNNKVTEGCHKSKVDDEKESHALQETAEYLKRLPWDAWRQPTTSNKM